MRVSGVRRDCGLYAVTDILLCLGDPIRVRQWGHVLQTLAGFIQPSPRLFGQMRLGVWSAISLGVIFGLPEPVFSMRLAAGANDGFVSRAFRRLVQPGHELFYGRSFWPRRTHADIDHPVRRACRFNGGPRASSHRVDGNLLTLNWRQPVSKLADDTRCLPGCASGAHGDPGFPRHGARGTANPKPSESPSGGESGVESDLPVLVTGDARSSASCYGNWAEQLGLTAPSRYRFVTTFGADYGVVVRLQFPASYEIVKVICFDEGEVNRLIILNERNEALRSAHFL